MATTTNQTSKLIYLQGIGYVSEKHASLYRSVKAIAKSFNCDNLTGVLVDESTNRVGLYVGGIDKTAIVAQKHKIGAEIKKQFPNTRVVHAQSDGYKVWCSYFSDGNFKEYVCGVEFFLM